MRPLRMIVINELEHEHEVVEMLRPARDEVIEAFLLQRLNESLREGVEIG